MSRSARVAATHSSGLPQVFQWLSYLQYPAMLTALFYVMRPFFNGMDGLLDAYNSALLFAGVGIGMSSLQDPTRTQNELSRMLWQHPGKGYLLLCMMTAQTLLPIILGVLGTLLAKSTALAQLSLGLVAFGLGMIGLLKTAVEMREHHRLDRRPVETAEEDAA